ncbi:MAG: hypothetical protein VX675_01775 [Planctomycetota bacterium]|nr:hypothetical protein [Planctomycetota bacterium]
MSVLRPTVSKAFSLPAGRNHSVLEPGTPRGHAQALGRFFRNLQLAFRRRGALPGSVRVGEVQDATSRLLEGLEFVIETPRGVFRLQNSLHGAVSIRELLDTGSEEEVELLGVQCRDGSYVPIRKTASEAGMAGNFSFTSIHVLVDEYMDGAMSRRGRTGIEYDPG